MDEVTYVRNAWNTALQIAQDREYCIPDEYNKLSEADFKHLFSEKNLDISSQKENKSLYIKFLLSSRTKPSTLKDIVDEIKNLVDKNNKLEVIIVLKTKPNNSILKLEKDKDYNFIQIMWCKQLQINPTKHEYVPKHTKLSIKEGEQLLKKYSLSSKYQLPLLLKDDVIARYYNYKSGDIIKITNTISSANTGYEYFRCVK